MKGDALGFEVEEGELSLEEFHERYRVLTIIDEEIDVRIDINVDFAFYKNGVYDRE